MKKKIPILTFLLSYFSFLKVCFASSVSFD